jgi:glutaredoxin 3
MTKEYLSQRGIEYTDYDVTADKEKAKEAMHISGESGVPVIVIDGKVVYGFDRKKLDKLLSPA